ncbi:MAG: AzlD domain-containing protein [Alphaproteobacteria bacterium]|nr:AzlD domain-containing protein [Alphaproteobacteria bacterium]
MSGGFLATPEAALIIVLVALIAHEPFRWLGAYLGRGLAGDSEIFVWVRTVATALVAGLVARLVLFPAGVLEAIPLAVRLTAVVAGIAVFLWARRHLGAGVFSAAAVLLALGVLAQ